MCRHLYYVWKVHSHEGEMSVVCKHRVKIISKDEHNVTFHFHCDFALMTERDGSEALTTEHRPRRQGYLGYYHSCTFYSFLENAPDTAQKTLTE